MKRIALVFIAMLLIVGSAEADVNDQIQAVIARKNASGGACTTSNDSELVDTGWVAHSASLGQDLICSKLTLSATDDITEYLFGMCDNGSDAGTVTISLYDDSTNEPGTMIAGTDITIAMGDLTNCGDGSTPQTATLAATKVDVGETTVWLCSDETSSIRLVSYDSGPSGRICYGTAGSFSCADNTVLLGSVYGCN